MLNLESGILNLRSLPTGWAFRTCAAVLLLCAWAAGASAEDVPYGVPAAPWPDTFGNHRARVQVVGKSDAVRVHLPWRRRDAEPDKKQIIVVDAATGKEAANVARIAVARESGDLAFQPATVPGEYHIYYLPFKIVPGAGGYSGNYLPEKSAADPQWLKRTGLAADLLPKGTWRDLPDAKVLEFQARTEFDRFDPMELPATRDELARFLEARPGQPWLVFPEDRKFPIRMRDELPVRWTRAGPSSEFRGEARRNEYYAFQIGVYAARAAVEDVAADFGDLRLSDGKTIPASALTCFNLGGTDWLGRPLKKTVSVAQGAVQPLWFGVDVPKDAAPGEYRGTVTIRPRGLAPVAVNLALTVSDQVLEDRGDGEPWRHSRLRWLNSTIGMDDEPVAPFTPLVVNEDLRIIRCLGREVRLDVTGLPVGIATASAEQVLAEPVTLTTEFADGLIMVPGHMRITRKAAGRVEWEAEDRNAAARLRLRGSMESDGYLHFEAALVAQQAVELKDVALDIPVRGEVAKYLMGFGRKGGARPKDWSWKWGGRVYYDSGWIGDVGAGLQLELRGAAYAGPMVNLYWNLRQLKPPATWDNDGKGGVTVTGTEGGPVVLRAFSGPRRLEAGQELTWEFALLVTPVRPLDPAKHFRERYVHAPWPVAEVAKSGANVINIHHATPFNPYINYPFFATAKLAAYAKEAHEAGAKVKIYYTVRELTNHVTEMWALRSLGNEVLAPGRGGGYPWLREHLASDYSPAWYHRFEDGDVCAAVVTTGDSRWYNYYCEGLAWILKNAGIDGLYLDDVTYDRTTLKRMRKIMDRLRPGCLIDLHSNTDFSRGPANQYMEFFPYIDRLWFGEGFNYNAPPDYWLVEISGIPFGLMGEMLQNGGNPWRGMLYGMTTRLAASGDPRPLWKLWDEFGISGARLVGYWDPGCPVRTGRPDVLATAYVRKGRTLLAVASWAAEPARVRLDIDWKSLGLDPAAAKLRAPAVAGFQDAADFKPGGEVPVQPGRGWLLILSE